MPITDEVYLSHIITKRIMIIFTKKLTYGFSSIYGATDTDILPKR